jgi:rod shape-determining protein MreC
VYDRNVRRRRAVLGLLVAGSLILLTAYFGESAGGPLRSVQRGFLEVLAPIQEGASRALKPVSDLVGWFGDTWEAKGERDKLKKERDRLRQEAARRDFDQRQLKELQGLYGIDQESSLTTQKPVTARVIGRSPTVWFATITVDKGSSAGVKVDQPVVNGQGLVGKVTEVAGGAAKITLITDSTSAVSAKIAITGDTGVLQTAVGQPNNLVLDDIGGKSKITKGMRVVTAGSRSNRLESLFPPGIPIGSISKVDTGETDLFQRVHVRPYADVRRLSFVQILTKPQTAVPTGPVASVP